MELSYKQYVELNKNCLLVIEQLKEAYYEEKFTIDTIRNDEDEVSQQRIVNFQYAPTSYSFLEYFFKKYPFKENDHLVDFGCGKGRVIIMAADHQCPTLTGIEIDSIRYNCLKDNVQKFKLATDNKSHFNLLNSDANDIVIDDTINKFFFFNPFHLKIYIRVIKCINKSLEISPRECWLILYRPVPSTLKYIEGLGTFYKKEQVTVDFSGEYILYAIYTNKKEN